MEGVYKLGKFFPARTSISLLDQYLSHHLSSVMNCVENELYSSAYSHLHLLYMSFTYIQLLRIAKEKEQEFNYGWIGFPGQEKDYLKDPASPFSFSKVREQTVFRFFRLINLNDADIGNIAKPVDIRNKQMHASGVIYCADAESFEKELAGYINRMKLVIEKEMPLLQNIYKGLLDTYDDEYKFMQDDLESNYQDQYMFSEYELILLARNRRDKVSVFIQQSYE